MTIKAISTLPILALLVASLAETAAAAATPVINVSPVNPVVASTVTAGTVVAVVSVTMSDGSSFNGELGFGPPYNNDGSIFSLSGSSLIVNASGPGLPQTSSMTNVTLTATTFDVAISTPSNGAVLSGTAGISGTASDGVTISSVAVSIDSGAYISASGTSTWTFSLNTVALTNGAHTLQAKAWDVSGNISTSSFVNVTVGNGVAPSSGAFSNVTASQLQANWGSNGSPAGTHYLAVLSTGASPNTNGYSGNVSSNTLNLEAVFTSLNPNTTYFVSVATTGSGGAGAYTSLGSTATLAAVPASPAVSNVAQTNLTLAWNANSNPSGTRYTAQLSTSSAFSTLNASSSTLNTSATFLGLASNTTYFLRVAAVNSEGVSSAFAVAAASSTKVALPLSAAPSNVDSSSVTANWGQNGNSTTTVYLAEISTNAFASVNASTLTKLSSATFTSLTADTAYGFQVAAVGNDGSQTPFVALPSTSTLLLPPTLSTATFAAVNLSSVTIQWLSGGDGGGTLYKAQVSTNNFLTVNVSSLTYNLSAVFGTTGAGPALVPNTTYFFQVQATTAANSSAFLALGSTITPAAVPGAGSPLFIGVTTTSFTVNWTDNGNSTSTIYSVELATAAGFSAITASTQITGAAATFSSLTANSIYFARLAAFSSENGRFSAYTTLGSTATTANAPGAAPFSGITSSSFTVNWTANGNPPGTLYEIQVATTPGFGAGSSSTGSSSLSAGFTNLSPNTTYYAQVAPYSLNTNSYTNFTGLGAVETLAAVPSSPAAIAVTTTSETLGWSANSNPLGTQYLAEISTSNSFTTLNASSSTLNTSATFLGLTVNTTYFLRVAAVNTEGMTSAFAVAAASSTNAASPLSAAPSNVTSSAVTANWTADGNSSSTFYLAQISTNGFVSLNSSVRTQSLSAAFTGLAADTAYNFQVAALGNGGSQTPFTALPSTSTPLLPPAVSSAAFISVNFASVTVQWLSDGNGPSTLYNAQVSTNDFATVNASSRTYDLSAVFGTTGAGPALAPNTTYFFQVQAATAANSTAFTFLGSTATPALPPSGTTIVAVTSTTVKLAWSANGNPLPGVTFQLWQDLANNFPSPIETFLTSTSTTVSSLSPNTTYFFKVRVLGNDGIFTAFDSIVATLAPGAPGTPAGVALGVSSISWNWAAAQYANSYQLIRAQSGNVIASTPTLAFFDTHLATNTAYGLIVQGVDARGPGSLSAPATFYTLAAPPSGSLVTPVFATSATLSWSLNTNPSGTDAEVQRSTNGASFISLVSSDVALNYVDAGLLGCSTYYYRVRNSNGNGLRTSFDAIAGPFVTSNTIPAPASGFSAQSVPAGHVNLNWTQSPTEGIVGYQLFYDAGSGSINYNLPSDLLATLSASATTYETAVLPSSAAYTFALLALHRCDTQSQGVFAMAGSSVALNDVRADIIGPASGHHVFGNDLTVYAQLVAGTPAQTAQVTFQYRRTGTMSWSTMTAADVFNPNPATAQPYFIHWNVDSLAPGSYDLSAVALDVSGSSDTNPDVVTVVVDPVTPDILETTAGGLVQTVFTNVPNTFNTGGNGSANPLVSITVPGGLLSGSTVSVTVTPSGTPPGTTPPDGLSLVPNLMLQVALSNGQSLLNGGTAPISFFSPSAPGTNPQIYVYNTITDSWSQDFATTYDPATHQITGNTPHFSVFAVLTGGAETPAQDLSGVRVYPNPYRPGSNNPDLGGGNTGIFFDQLPNTASIKIYTVAGRLVTSFDASSATGAVNWDARNDKGRDVASGLYLAVITSPGSKTVTKKILVVR